MLSFLPAEQKCEFVPSFPDVRGLRFGGWQEIHLKGQPLTCDTATLAECGVTASDQLEVSGER